MELGIFVRAADGIDVIATVFVCFDVKGLPNIAKELKRR